MAPLPLRLIRAVSFLSFVSFAAPTASAQCQAWSDGFQAPGVGGRVRASIVFDDGHGPGLFVGGTFSGGPDEQGSPYCSRWDGSHFNALGSGMNNAVNALAVHDDGTGLALWAGGAFTTADGNFAPRVARWNGTSWSAPASGPLGPVNALTVFDDGSGSALYAAGDFTSAGPADTLHIARWNGTSWSALGSGLDGKVRALAVYDDGSGPALYAGGDFAHAGSTTTSRIARWDGSTWSSVSSGINGPVDALLTHDDGAGARLVAGGQFNSAGGVDVAAIAAWDGTSWSALGSGANFRVSSLATYDDGTGPGLLAGGFFTLPALGIARWNGSSWSALGVGVTVPQSNFSIDSICVFDEGSGARVFAGGFFSRIGDAGGSNLARFDGNDWSGVSARNGFDGTVYSLASFDAGSGPVLHALGDFTRAGAGWAASVARWDADHWAKLPDVTGPAFAGAGFDDGSGPALFVGGNFTAPFSSSILRWDEVAWSQVGGGLHVGGVYDITTFDDGAGLSLFAAGSFRYANEGPALTLVDRIARWNGVTWSGIGGLDGIANAMAVFDDGSGPALYVGGAFENAGGVPALHIARWNGTSWSAVGAGFGDDVGTLKVFDDGSGPALYVAGGYSGASSGPKRWNGSSWSVVGGQAIGGIGCLESFDDGSGPALYAGGGFWTLGGLLTNSIARWNGTAWLAVGGGFPDNIGDQVYAMLAIDDGSGPSLWAGGHFHQAGNVLAKSIERWSSCGNVGTPFCSGDGSGTACPCGNAGSAGHGCASSFNAAGSSLHASGLPNVTNDTLVLESTGTSSSVLTLFQGTTRQNGGAGAVFGDGLRCAGGTLVRLAAVAAVGGIAHYPNAGSPSISLRGAIPSSAGVRRTYQAWYRNSVSFCTPSTFNLSNGLEIVWGN